MASFVSFITDDLPPKFLEVLRTARPQIADAWLETLPGIVADAAERWDLDVDRWFPGLSFNFVAPARLPDGREVVLKTGLFHEDQDIEVAALKAYGGVNCCSLVADDRPTHTFLIERLRPGTMLSELEDDDEATRIAAGIMRGLRVMPPQGVTLPTVQDWGSALDRIRPYFDGGTGPFSDRLVTFAQETYAALGRPAPDDIVLHGDLHHFNILRAERAPWLAIDPHGVVGPAVYETGALLRNPTPERSGDPRRQARRIDILADELGFDRQLITHWAVAQAVLSVWWSIEDGAPAQPGQLAMIDALAALL